MKQVAIAVFIAIGLLGAAPHAAHSAKNSPATSPKNGSAAVQYGVWTLHMAEVDFNYKTGDFSTPDKVYVTRQGGDITADRASGNQKSKRITFYGNVVAHDTQGGLAGIAGATPSSSGGPSTLTADQLQVDGAARVYTAIGHVHYVHGDTTTDADKGILNDVTHTLNLEGNVHLTQGTRNMTADRVIYDTITGNAHAEGDVVMQFPSEISPHFATPRPIKVPKIPFQRNEQPTPAPSPLPG